MSTKVTKGATSELRVDWTKKLAPELHLDQGIEALKRDAPLGESFAADREAGDDRDPILDDLAEAVAQVRANAESIINQAKILRANELKTPLARERDVMRLADQRSKVGLPLLDQARSLARHRVAELLKSTMPAATKHDCEVRAVLRGMNDDQRRAALAKFDDAVASAVLNAPAIASGLSQQAHDNFLARYREARHPLIVQRVARAERAVEMLDRAAEAYLHLTLKVVDRKAVAEAEKCNSAARRALADDA